MDVAKDLVGSGNEERLVTQSIEVKGKKLVREGNECKKRYIMPEVRQMAGLAVDYGTESAEDAKCFEIG